MDITSPESPSLEPLQESGTRESARAVRSQSRWPLERVLFVVAGTMTLVSVALAAIVSPWFLLLTAFVGINQWFFVTVRACPASLVLQRIGVEPQCPW